MSKWSWVPYEPKLYIEILSQNSKNQSQKRIKEKVEPNKYVEENLKTLLVKKQYNMHERM